MIYSEINPYLLFGGKEWLDIDVDEERRKRESKSYLRYIETNYGS